MIDKEQIGLRFLQFRKSLKLSQSAFGEALNVKRETISQIENGVIAPSLELVLKIIARFSINFESLFFDKKFGAPLPMQEPDKAKEIEYLEKTISALEQSNKDKDQIIQLLSAK